MGALSLSNSETDDSSAADDIDLLCSFRNAALLYHIHYLSADDRGCIWPLRSGLAVYSSTPRHITHDLHVRFGMSACARARRDVTYLVCRIIPEVGLDLFFPE